MDRDLARDEDRKSNIYEDRGIDRDIARDKDRNK